MRQNLRLVLWPFRSRSKQCVTGHQQVLAASLTLFQLEGQIMPTIYWCPHQVLKATGTPVAKIFADVNYLHFSERHGKIFTKNGEHWYKTSTSKNQMRIYISHPKRFLIVDTQFYILYARFTFFMSKNWSIEAKLNNFHLSEMA